MPLSFSSWERRRLAGSGKGIAGKTAKIAYFLQNGGIEPYKLAGDDAGVPGQKNHAAQPGAHSRMKDLPQNTR